MFSFADFAFEDLELIGDALHSIPQGAEELIVHFCFAEHFYEFLVGQEIKYCIFHRLYFIEAFVSGDEVQVDQVRIVSFRDFLGIHDELLHVEVGPLVGEAKATSFQNDQIVVVVEMLDHLFRVAHPHLDLFSQVE